MQDVIRLLPDALANQIAAGEVVQRPSSAVKELLENAIDAGAEQIRLVIKDAGKTLIQVIDDGVGMSEMDARHCFNRHATSKITAVDDLFNLHTFGFRGEALASIAAIAQVTLRTRRKIEEVGTEIQIDGSEIQSQVPIACPKGTNISVKNLFFNVPARRNFLKSNGVEFKYIVEEFQRVALCNPQVSMSLHHNDKEQFNLPSSGLPKRIINLFGKSYQDKILSCEEAIQGIKISGYIGKPEASKKTRGEQFFFANGRFIKHPYMHHAVMKAYEDLLADGHYPFYLLSIEVDPKQIDINVHPTKTEVKFEDERTLYALVKAATKKALANHGAVPPIDFNFDVNFGNDKLGSNRTKNTLPTPPSSGKAMKPTSDYPSPPSRRERSNLRNWEKLFEEKANKSTSHGPADSGATHKRTATADWSKLPKDLTDIPELSSNAPTTSHNPHHEEETDNEQGMIFSSAANELTAAQVNTGSKSSQRTAMQIRDQYLLSQIKSGLMIIDQAAAMERILYDRFIKRMGTTQGGASQKLVFPRTVELSVGDLAMLETVSEEAQSLGLSFSVATNSSIVVHGLPAEAQNMDEKNLVEKFLEQVQYHQDDISLNSREVVAKVMAQRLCHQQIKSLTQEEMNGLIEQLFACSNPNYSPSGKKIIAMMNMEQLVSLFEG